jgi:hypothetical protein
MGVVDIDGGDSRLLAELLFDVLGAGGTAEIEDVEFSNGHLGAIVYPQGVSRAVR